MAAQPSGQGQTFGVTTVISLITETDPKKLEAATKSLDAWVNSGKNAGKGTEALSMGLRAGASYANTYVTSISEALTRTMARIKDIGVGSGLLGGSLKTIAGALVDSVTVALRTSTAGFTALASVLGGDVVLALAATAGGFAVVGAGLAAGAAKFYSYIQSSAEFVRGLKALETGMRMAGKGGRDFGDNLDGVFASLERNRGSQTFDGVIKWFDAIGRTASFMGQEVSAGFGHMSRSVIGNGSTFTKWAENINSVVIPRQRALIESTRQFSNIDLIKLKTSSPEVLKRGLNEIAALAGTTGDALTPMFEKMRNQTKSTTAAFNALVASAQFNFENNGRGFAEMSQVLQGLTVGARASDDAFRALGVDVVDGAGKTKTLSQLMSELVGRITSIGEAEKKALEKGLLTPEMVAKSLREKTTQLRNEGQLTLAMEKKLSDEIVALKQQGSGANSSARAAQIQAGLALIEHNNTVEIGLENNKIKRIEAMYGQSLASIEKMQSNARVATGSLMRAEGQTIDQIRALQQSGAEQEVAFYQQRKESIKSYYSDLISAAKQYIDLATSVGTGNTNKTSLDFAKEYLNILKQQNAATTKIYELNSSDKDGVQQRLAGYKIILNDTLATRDGLISRANVEKGILNTNLEIRKVMAEQFDVTGSSAAFSNVKKFHDERIQMIEAEFAASNKGQEAQKRRSSEIAKANIGDTEAQAANYRKLGQIALSSLTTDFGTLQNRRIESEKLLRLMQSGKAGLNNDSAYQKKVLEGSKDTIAGALFDVSVAKQAEKAMKALEPLTNKLTAAVRAGNVDKNGNNQDALKIAAEIQKKTQTMGLNPATLDMLQKSIGETARATGMSGLGAKSLSTPDNKIDLGKIRDEANKDFEVALKNYSELMKMAGELNKPIGAAMESMKTLTGTVEDLGKKAVEALEDNQKKMDEQTANIKALADSLVLIAKFNNEQNKENIEETRRAVFTGTLKYLNGINDWVNAQRIPEMPVPSSERPTDLESNSISTMKSGIDNLNRILGGFVDAVKLANKMTSAPTPPPPAEIPKLKPLLNMDDMMSQVLTGERQITLGKI